MAATFKRFKKGFEDDNEENAYGHSYNDEPNIFQSVTDNMGNRIWLS